jgi:hypothetical protein
MGAANTWVVFYWSEKEVVMAKYVQGSVDQPAAGADFSFSPSNGDSFKLLTLRAELLIAADGGAEAGVLEFADKSGNAILDVNSTPAGEASATFYFNWAARTTYLTQALEASPFYLFQPLPDLWMPEGTTISTITQSLVADDQWTNIVYTALVGEEFEHLVLLERLIHRISSLDVALRNANA